MKPKQRYPICILATACVPWNADGTFAEAIFRRQVRNLVRHLTPHVYIFGTAGEGYAVSESQFDRICRVFREETSHPGLQPMVGIISLSLPTVLDRIERARAIGFRDFQISLPSWGPPTEAETRRFFREVCGRFPDCRFLHYNLMRTKRLVTPEEYAILAQENPNLVATKNSTADMDRIHGLITRTPHLTHFLTETGYAYGSLIGRCGLLISMAATKFSTGREYFAAGQRRQTARLWMLEQELANLTRDLVALCPRHVHMDGAFDKLFCKIHDPAFPLRLLPPYEGIPDHTFRKIVAMMRRRYPRWI